MDRDKLVASPYSSLKISNQVFLRQSLTNVVVHSQMVSKNALEEDMNLKRDSSKECNGQYRRADQRLNDNQGTAAFVIPTLTATTARYREINNVLMPTGGTRKTLNSDSSGSNSSRFITVEGGLRIPVKSAAFESTSDFIVHGLQLDGSAFQWSPSYLSRNITNEVTETLLVPQLLSMKATCGHRGTNGGNSDAAHNGLQHFGASQLNSSYSNNLIPLKAIQTAMRTDAPQVLPSAQQQASNHSGLLLSHQLGLPNVVLGALNAAVNGLGLDNEQRRQLRQQVMGSTNGARNYVDKSGNTSFRVSTMGNNESPTSANLPSLANRSNNKNLRASVNGNGKKAEHASSSGSDSVQCSDDNGEDFVSRAVSPDEDRDDDGTTVNRCFDDDDGADLDEEVPFDDDDDDDDDADNFEDSDEDDEQRRAGRASRGALAAAAGDTNLARALSDALKTLANHRQQQRLMQQPRWVVAPARLREGAFPGHASYASSALQSSQPRGQQVSTLVTIEQLISASYRRPLIAAASQSACAQVSQPRSMLLPSNRAAQRQSQPIEHGKSLSINGIASNRCRPPTPTSSGGATENAVLLSAKKKPVLSVATPRTAVVSPSSRSSPSPQPHRISNYGHPQQHTSPISNNNATNKIVKSQQISSPQQNLVSNSSLAAKQLLIAKATAQQNDDGVLAPLRSSLFSNVPPTLVFAADGQSVAALPREYAALMRWRTSTITPNVLKRILARSGFKLTLKDDAWVGCWGKHMKADSFRSIGLYQKFNHFPASFQIGRKDRLWRNLSQLQARFGRRDFSFFPQTFILPQDFKLLKRVFEDPNTGSRQRWIIKPPASARGNGIRLACSLKQIPKKRPVIVQRYIHQPMLINDSKFDVRLYVYVACYDPLRAYIYTDGLARFASAKYSTSFKDLPNKYMHLTNYSVNKHNEDYEQNGEVNACKGHKWSLRTLWSYFSGDISDPSVTPPPYIDAVLLWPSIKDIVLKAVIAAEPFVASAVKLNVPSRYSVHELFGFDVLLDKDTKPWLLEVNISPSLHSDSPLDFAVKGAMLTDLANLAGYRLPQPKHKNPPAFKQESNLAADPTAIPQTNGVESALSNYFQVAPEDLSPLCNDPRMFSTSLSNDERLKHSFYVQHNRQPAILSTILDCLTPDDIRVLVEFEDERTRMGAFEPLIPTPTSYRYLRFLETPRYYNLLLDKWTQKYYDKDDSSCRATRHPGIELLEQLCRRGVHLQSPSTDARHIWSPPSNLSELLHRGQSEQQQQPPPSRPSTAGSSSIMSSNGGSGSHCSRTIVNFASRPVSPIRH